MQCEKLKTYMETGRVVFLPARSIRPNPAQPRRIFREDALAELADSIRRHGILQPLSVRRVGNGYELIAASGFANALDMMKATVRSHVALCEGQGDDLMGNPGTADADYISICERKTGEAFALAAELGALAAGVDSAPYRRYGLDFGVLFQLKDDLSDGEAPDGVRELAERLEKELSATEVCRKLGEWYRIDEG